MVENIEDKRAGSISSHLTKIAYLTSLERETGVDAGPLIVATWQEVSEKLQRNSTRSLHRETGNPVPTQPIRRVRRHIPQER